MSDEKIRPNVYNTSIRLVILALIVGWCLLLLYPFVNMIVWGVILAMAFGPAHQFLTKRMGFVFSGVPYAGIWALLIFVLALLQFPTFLVVLPVVIYLFSVKSTVVAVLWTVYLLAAGLSDNILKPLLLGKGAPVPMLVIFVGVIGGFMLSGLIGLFTGAIVMSIGYKLYQAWLDEDNPSVPKLAAEKTGDSPALKNRNRSFFVRKWGEMTEVSAPR